MTSASPSSVPDISLRKAARIAGIAYLLVFVVSILANSFALQKLVVLGDATTTANNIAAHETLFRLGIAGWMIVLACDAVAAWGLYVFLKPVNRSLSLLAAWFRLIFVAVLVVSFAGHFSVLELLNGPQYLTGIDANHLRAQAMQLLQRHEFNVHAGFLFFGIHILLLGYLAFRSGYVPKILGILLLIASVGYLIDSFGNFVSPAYANNPTYFVIFVGVPAVISELFLTVWLLVKGTRVTPLSGS